MVSDVTVTGAVQDAAQTQQQRLGLAEDFNQFLTLLTTQLQNQDPLNPMDSTEFTSFTVKAHVATQVIHIKTDIAERNTGDAAKLQADKIVKFLVLVDCLLDLRELDKLVCELC